MTRLPIRTRLTLAYVAVLAAATVVLTGAAWWLMRTSMQRAADASLADRVAGTRRFIAAAQHGLPPDELQDEFQEFADLTRGEALLEVWDDKGRTLCRPALTGWETLHPPISGAEDLRVAAIDILGRPYRAIETRLELDGETFHLKAAVPMALEYAALSRFGWLLAAVVPAVMLLAAAGGFWLSGRALAPVDRMTRDVQQISVGDPGRRLDVPAADDELRRLAETFNDMLARWQRAFAEMARFTADASHELRTPVSLARTTAEVALARPRTIEGYQAALSEVLACTERMTILVDDLLSLARSDAGVEAAAVTPVELGDLAREAVHELQPARRSSRPRAAHDAARATAHRVRQPHVAAAPPADSAGQRREVHAGSRIRLAADFNTSQRASSGAVGAHRGAGHRSRDRSRRSPRVFDRFYRGAPAREMAPDGSGLGLSIARMIVDRHHGTIAVSDPPSGPGLQS